MKFNFKIDSGRPFDVVGMGMNAVDNLIIAPHFPVQGTKMRLSHFEVQGGGQAGNCLSALSRLGMKTVHLGKVGDDINGEISLKTLESEGVDVSKVIKVKGARSQFAFIIVDEISGERTIIAARDPLLDLALGDFSREDVISGKILFIDGSGGKCVLEAAKWAHEEGIPVVLDIERVKDSVFDMMRFSDVIIASCGFMREYMPDSDPPAFLARVKNEFGPCFCGITLGELGSMGVSGGEIVEVPAYKVEAVDTTGAGDIYHAAFIYGIFRNWEICDIMRFASASAALKCRCYGSRKGAPSLTEIRDFMGVDYPPE